MKTREDQECFVCGKLHRHNRKQDGFLQALSLCEDCEVKVDDLVHQPQYKLLKLVYSPH